MADEGGTAYWLSGQYASFAAVPATPGFALAVMPYVYQGDLGGSRPVLRAGEVSAKLDVKAFAALTQVSYAPDVKLFGGQPNFGLTFFPGASGIDLAAAEEIGASSGRQKLSQSIAGFGDLYPIASIAWNRGVNNFMTYLTGDVPVGRYNAKNAINLGDGHGAVDAGGAYTYLDMASGREFSATVGVTYNLENTATHYTSGVDLHLDWAASQFLNDNWHVGLVGYVYKQVTPDRYPTAGVSGALMAQILGGYQSGVASVGPEVGRFIDLGKRKAYVSLRGYWEFWSQNRPRGEAAFLTVSLPLGP